MTKLGPRTRIVLAWLPAVLYTTLIWWLSSQVLQVPYVSRVPLQDKGIHFLEYGALSWFITLAVVITWRDSGPRAVAIGSLMTVALGFLDELHQAFVPGRFSDAGDLLADAIGAVTFSILYVLCVRVLLSRRGARGEREAQPAQETRALQRTSDPPVQS